MLTTCGREVRQNNTALRHLLAATMLWLLGAGGNLSFAGPAVQPTIAIIIDDMGNHYVRGEKLINLPYPLTLAFLPKRPYTHILSNHAYEKGKEILLHEPMENEAGLALGLGGLTLDMNAKQIRASFEQSLRSVPHAIGINNHMGSKLTVNWQRMSWLMAQIKKHPVFFVDSRTSGNSVAAKVAASYDIPNLSRDVFLDNELSRKNVRQQFLKLIKIAREKGSAIAIGHPHRVTIDYLSWALPKLDRRGISIATASALWQIRNPERTMYADRKKVPNGTALASKSLHFNQDIN